MKDGKEKRETMFDGIEDVVETALSSSPEEEEAILDAVVGPVYGPLKKLAERQIAAKRDANPTVAEFMVLFGRVWLQPSQLPAKRAYRLATSEWRRRGLPNRQVPTLGRVLDELHAWPEEFVRRRRGLRPAATAASDPHRRTSS